MEAGDLNRIIGCLDSLDDAIRDQAAAMRECAAGIVEAMAKLAVVVGDSSQRSRQAREEMYDIVSRLREGK